MCSSKTFGECMQRGLFGESGPSKLGDFRAAIATGATPLLLLNFSTRVLYGPFYATAQPQLYIVPDAWEGNATKARRPGKRGSPGGGGDGEGKSSPYPVQVPVGRHGRVRKAMLPKDLQLTAGKQTLEGSLSLLIDLLDANGQVAQEADAVPNVASSTDGTAASVTASTAVPLASAAPTMLNGGSSTFLSGGRGGRGGRGGSRSASASASVANSDTCSESSDGRGGRGRSGRGGRGGRGASAASSVGASFQAGAPAGAAAAAEDDEQEEEEEDDDDDEVPEWVVGGRVGCDDADDGPGTFASGAFLPSPQSAYAMPPPPPPPPAATPLPLIAIDCASVGSEHTPFQNGYLNVEAVDVVLRHYLGLGFNARLLVPRLWMNAGGVGGGHGGGGGAEQVAARRVWLVEKMEDGFAVLAPEAASSPSSGLPPLMEWALQERAVLVTNSKLSEAALASYHLPDQHEACRQWLRQWVCPFRFVPVVVGGGKAFQPSPHFVTPALPPEGVESQLHAMLLFRPPSAVSELFDAAKLQMVGEQELPAVAAERYRLLHRLSEQIHARCAERSDRMLFFHERKTAWDVLNKWVFHFVTRRARLSEARGPLGSPLVTIDAVIPSTLPSYNGEAGDGTDHLAELLMEPTPRGYSLDQSDARRTAAELAYTSEAMAKQVKQTAHDEDVKWRARVKRGRIQASDAALGVELEPLRDGRGGTFVGNGHDHHHHHLGAAHAAHETEEVVLRWSRDREESGRGGARGERISGDGSAASGNGGGDPLEVRLWRKHFETLSAAYTRLGHPPQLLLTRMLVMAARYESLSEDKSAYQAALPRKMQRALRRVLCVRHECYASPLNRYHGFGARSFCSAFGDTDAFFGSQGPFQSFRPKCGSFQANPPFDHASVSECFGHIAVLCEQAAGPISFVVIVPEMGGHLPWMQAIRPFLVRCAFVPKGQHKYLMGLQHRRTGEGDGERFWEPDKPSRIYFLQNVEGRKAWPVTDSVEAHLVACFDVRDDEEDDEEDDDDTFPAEAEV